MNTCDKNSSSERQLQIRTSVIPVGPFCANCVILWGEEKAAWIVDPGADADDILAFLREKGLSPALIACTHGHFDHIDAINAILAAHPGLPVHVNPADEPMFGHPLNCWEPEYRREARPGTLVCDLTGSAVLSAGGISAKVLHTPGHTPGSVCLYFQDEALLLTGDTLFAGSCGRTDFPGGSMADMAKSLKRLAALPPDTTVITGHGPATSIGREKAENPFMQGI